LKDFKKVIDEQIIFNQGKNFFHDDFPQNMKFCEDVVQAFERVGSLSDDDAGKLVDYATERSLTEFCRINQFFYFGKEGRDRLRSVYQWLYTELKRGDLPIEKIAEIHYGNLKDWILHTNLFAKNLYQNRESLLQPIPASEYSADFQLMILGMDADSLLEPVLDIGCGQSANLVNFLRNEGVEAYGIDRFVYDDQYLIQGDWLDYHFRAASWGTLISNLGFSVHFIHHHLREDGEYKLYADKYMQILNSLVPGGSLYYAPGLPFIECFLDSDRFNLQVNQISGFNLTRVKITRIP